MTKIEAARQEYRDWCCAIGINTMEKVNETLKQGYGVKLINICEARQERKYAEVADQILWNHGQKRIVMMSGPSSSGKTSSSHRIAQQCIAVGLIPKVIELDNYFVSRERTPRDENGEYDFEALEAMDIELLGNQLNELLAGREVELPRFDFVEGRQVFEGRKMKLEDGDVLFMEGIHALNPALTPSVDQEKIFKVYISALTALPGGEKVHYTTTDKRLLRRIVRDNRTRGISPEENADIVFNSSTLYDMPLLKYYAEPLLYGVSEASPAHGKAMSLIELLSHVTALKPAEIAAIPPTSIMREFIGGQTL